MAIVYLIGAGPGDPGLITVRGMQCLASADVVLYDHLVPARLLRYARADAEKIDVGVAAPQPLEQEAICYLLAEKAREGKTVARLKWGDPFVFDRGGAEALFLHEQGEHLRWFDARPLFGKRVLVTRPREQAGELVELLEAMGAEAIEAPMIRILPPDDYAPLDDACARAGTFDWIIFSSANTVDAFMERLL